MIDAPLTVASHQLPLVEGARADQKRPERGESMRFVRITKSMEEVGKVILCTDVFSFIGATWEVGEGGLESTRTEQPGGKLESLIFPRTCWSFNLRTRESITVSAGWC